MTIKLKLSNGKEIELTKEEFDELKESFQEAIYPYWTYPNPWDLVRNPYPYGYPTYTTSDKADKS